MVKKPVFTIGHGRRTSEQLLELLRQHDIRYLIDVRSQPYSRFNPQFNQNALQTFLENNGVNYVFMGDLLGGRPKDPLCYNIDGKIDYDSVSTKEFFLKGIARLETAYHKDLAIALMCSESKPAECHRTHLISKALVRKQISVRHIDEKGVLRNQEEVVNK